MQHQNIVVLSLFCQAIPGTRAFQIPFSYTISCMRTVPPWSILWFTESPKACPSPRPSSGRLDHIPRITTCSPWARSRLRTMLTSIPTYWTDLSKKCVHVHSPWWLRLVLFFWLCSRLWCGSCWLIFVPFLVKSQANGQVGRGRLRFRIIVAQSFSIFWYWICYQISQVWKPCSFCNLEYFNKNINYSNKVGISLL